MERDALNQQHVTQCYAIALIKSHRSLLVVGQTTGSYVNLGYSWETTDTIAILVFCRS